MNLESDYNHPRVILHLDIDYFYAQVEELLNPELKDYPFGVQQGLNVVTINYKAREYGIKKWKPVKECLEKCPELVLVNGEDLSNYKKYSKKITELVHSIVGPSERMGLDEHYFDITKDVEKQMAEATHEDLKMVGPVHPNEDSFAECRCGCLQRLTIGSQKAQKIRDIIHRELKLTCSVGIAHNKLLAKLVGQMNKPNNQTTLAPMTAHCFMADLETLRIIMGIGEKTASRIEELGIRTIAELQSCDIKILQKSFTLETSQRLKEMSLGHDTSEVKPSGKSKTSGLEDSCSPISERKDAVEMFQDLLIRLVEIQDDDDERVPTAIRVTIRKFDIPNKTSNRETKQFNVTPSYFRCIDGKLAFADSADEKIMKQVMTLFDQMVDGQKFYINLLGLCFCRFQERQKGAASITNFLTKIIGNDAEKSSSSISHQAKKQKVDEASLSRSEGPSSPSNVDPEVWKALPLDVQRELIIGWNAVNIVRPSTTSLVTTMQKQRINKNMMLHQYFKKS